MLLSSSFFATGDFEKQGRNKETEYFGVFWGWAPKYSVSLFLPYFSKPPGPVAKKQDDNNIYSSLAPLHLYSCAILSNSDMFPFQ